MELAVNNKGDAIERRQAELEERALLYVAITRARKWAVKLPYGEVSPFLQPEEKARSGHATKGRSFRNRPK